MAAVRLPETGQRAVGRLALLGCLYLVAYLLLPSDRARDAAWSVFGFGAVAALLAGVAANRPARRWPWYALASGIALANVADAVAGYADWNGIELPDPGPSDIVYVLAYAPLLASVWGLLSRGDRRQDRENSLDALILAVGVAAAGYVLVVRPMLADAAAVHESRAATAVTLGYVVLDLLVVAFLCRLAFGGLRRNPAVWLACASMVCWLLGDLTNLRLAQQPPYPLGVALDELWLAGYWLAALAALHPAMDRIGTAARGEHRPPGGPRMAVLGTAGVLNPVLVAVLGGRLTGGSLVVLGCTGGLLFCLVTLRMWLLVGASARHVAELGAALDDKHHLEMTLRRMALHDPLTDLANRTAFTEAVARDLRTNQRGLLVMIDLDGFKAVNDTFGHSAGDQLLAAAALRLNRTLRTDDVLARLGGDEFAAWLPEVLTEERARQTAERLTASCRQPFSLREGEAVVTASVGAALARAGDDVDSLVARADHAMYQAKRAGKNAFMLASDRPAVPAD